MVQVLYISVIDVLRLAGPVSYCFVGIKDEVRLVHVFGQFWGMLINVNSVERVPDKSAIKKIISRS